MSLYYESSRFLEAPAAAGGSLKTQVYSATGLKSKPANIYALVSEAIKWSRVLSDVVERAEILKLERKLTPALAVLLAHDLLLSKQGVSAPKEHVLRLAIERHKTRLSAEFTKSRIKAGFATVPEWKTALESATSDAAETSNQNGSHRKWTHPRWIRFNTLKSPDNTKLSNTFANFKLADSLKQVLCAPLQDKIIARDEHIPNLVAVPNGSDLVKSQAYLNGRIIFQDKASCFPAFLLDPKPSDGDIIDACAAPGNKTTHLAALVSQALSNSEYRRVKPVTLYACERDKARSATLEKMVHTAGADAHDRVKLQCLARQDFLKLDPKDSRFSRVGAILLDPSCSGSGIVGRDEADTLASRYELVLPRTPEHLHAKDTSSKKRKRGRAAPKTHVLETSPVIQDTTNEVEENAPETETQSHKPLPERLAALSAFQLSLLQHAFGFPSVHKVVYSTCSVHADENEQVVLRALSCPAAQQRGWRVAPRAEQVEGMCKWPVRGDLQSVRDYWPTVKFEKGTAQSAESIAEACLRCEKGTEHGTMGFFAVLFVRDSTGVCEDLDAGVDGEKYEEDEEWQGLSGSDEDES